VHTICPLLGLILVFTLSLVLSTRQVVKTERCAFSEYHVFPGHGMKMVRKDGQPLIFGTAKAKRLYCQRLKPSKLMWTQVSAREAVSSSSPLPKGLICSLDCSNTRFVHSSSISRRNCSLHRLISRVMIEGGKSCTIATHGCVCVLLLLLDSSIVLVDSCV